MKIILILFGVLLMIAGGIFLFSPEMLIIFLTENLHSPSLYIAAILGRLVLGILLLLTARHSRYPTVMKVVGVLAIIAAIIFMIIGQENFGNFMSSIVPFFKPYSAIGGIVVCLVGGLLVYAYSGKRVTQT
jgi:uncharacterized BrkB/YihY/UPF0761 family membrane protein